MIDLWPSFKNSFPMVKNALIELQKEEGDDQQFFYYINEKV